MTHIVTSKSGLRFSKQPIAHDQQPIHFKLLKDTDQTIIGFGGAFTEASAYNLNRVNKEARLNMLKAYFDPVEGIGYKMGRIAINSCDFSLHTFDYVKPYDESLESFDISRENEVIRLIHDASNISGTPIDILASPWSPPAWMKTNESMIKGGKLKQQYETLWAKYMHRFVVEMRQKGIHVSKITMQNEPMANQRWESCLYDAKEEASLVKQVALVFQSEGTEIDIYVHDHNRDFMFERTQEMFKDETVKQFVKGIGFHWYGESHFEEVKKTHEAFPNHALLFTEGCQEQGPHPHSYEVGERYGLNMMHDFNHGTQGYIDWNLFLDMTGGPNHVSNLCSSPILVDVFPETMILNPSYYYIGHFSKYIKKDSVRIKTTSTEVLNVVFKTPDNQFVVVLMNQNDDEMNVSFECEQTIYSVVLEAHSISTIII
jgi:glucosylceramidase